MERDTDIGGPRRAFPATRHSVLERARSDDPDERRRAWDTLIAAYWKPTYFCLRLKWNLGNEDAKDLTQGFFTEAMTRGWFDRYDPARARFRTFLRTCLDGFAAKEHQAARRLKRGGGQVAVPLDLALVDREFAALAPGQDPDAVFHREWVRGVFGLAVDRLEAHCRAAGKVPHFDLFRRHDLDDAEPRPSYQALADEFDLPVTQVTNFLAWARREFRRLVLETLRDMTGNDEEFRAEARELLGVDPA